MRLPNLLQDYWDACVFAIGSVLILIAEPTETACALLLYGTATYTVFSVANVAMDYRLEKRGQTSRSNGPTQKKKEANLKKRLLKTGAFAFASAALAFFIPSELWTAALGMGGFTGIVSSLLLLGLVPSTSRSTQPRIGIRGKALTLAGLLVGTFFVLPDSVLYARSGLVRFVPLLVLFVLIPALIHSLLRDMGFQPFPSLGIAVGSILLVGPAFGLWAGHLERKELQDHGSTTTGEIYKRWESDNEWLYRARYVAEGDTFTTSSETDETGQLNVGDRVKILYSSQNPNVADIIEQSE